MTGEKTTSAIELCTGDYLDLIQPDVELITPEVLAHHLSHVNRYAGATARPFSVAEHTILVSKYLEVHKYNQATIFGGLHHDDSEAFLGDVTRPLKDQLMDYRAIESEMAKLIEEKLGIVLSDEMIADIKTADAWALACEAYFLLPSGGVGWWCEGLYNPQDKLQRNIAAWIMQPTQTNKFIQRLWLLRHYKWAPA